MLDELCDDVALTNGKQHLKKRKYIHLKGVFTLGETTKNILDSIEETRAEINNLDCDILNLKSTLHGLDGAGGKELEFRQNHEKYKALFWTMKKTR